MRKEGGGEAGQSGSLSDRESKKGDASEQHFSTEY